MKNIINLFQKSMGMAEPTARKVAKDRLSIMLVHQRSTQILENVDMEALQKEVAAVVQKYIKVAQNKRPQVSVKQDGDLDILEMHFPMEVTVTNPTK
mmetsp:Transcript_5521/g.5698  ORF Transcript_5521/g.5698 Transcript_5521/m.5698 type:complete len:97 (-) Transcript_5521:169-459(-)